MPMWKTAISGCGLLSRNALPVFLPENSAPEFPDPGCVQGEQIAIGGDLSPQRLLAAYRRGIFPWFSEGSPILWWSLDPRFVLFPQRIHVSRSLRKTIRRNVYTLTVDRAFSGVLAGCRESFRPGQNGTWITSGMYEAYLRLHRLGYAHSVEAWLDGELAGGLYGVALGGCFYGESMFSLASDASKTAFTALTGVLVDAGFGLVDCQQHTRYMESFGAVDMPRKNFLGALAVELEKSTLRGNWQEVFPGFPRSGLWASLGGSLS